MLRALTLYRGMTSGPDVIVRLEEDRGKPNYGAKKRGPYSSRWVRTGTINLLPSKTWTKLYWNIFSGIKEKPHLFVRQQRGKSPTRPEKRKGCREPADCPKPWHVRAGGKNEQPVRRWRGDYG